MPSLHSQPPRCPACGYDVSALPHDRCPECGATFDRASLAPPPRGAPVATIVVALALDALGFVAIASNVPKAWSPWPLHLFLPSLAGAGAHWWSCAIAPAFFLLWNLRLLDGRPDVPRRTVVLLVVLQSVNWLWILAHVPFAMKYQGAATTIGIMLVNALFTVALWRLLRTARTSRTFQDSLVFHGVMWAWIATNLLPYLGELP